MSSIVTPYESINNNGARKNASLLITKSVEDGLIHFGHTSLREDQQKIIAAVMKYHDVLVTMPTGGGKSLCYQLPAFCQPGYAVVISPILSLMEDQTRAMRDIGVEAVMLNSSQSYDLEQVGILEKLKNCAPHGGIKLLYVTPEKLTKSENIRNVLQHSHNTGLLSRFVVDEAHCVATW